MMVRNFFKVSPKYNRDFITFQALLFTGLCHASGHVTGCDTCHAASGDNVTGCGQVSGLYTRPQLPPGLTIVTRIPRGSCDVSVTLLRPRDNHLGQCQCTSRRIRRREKLSKLKILRILNH